MPASSSSVRMTFNPGPSQLSAATMDDVRELAGSGLLAASHRSDRVRTVVRESIEALRAAMRVPADYVVVFQPSSTAAMECILRNCVREASLHFTNGAFAERFARTADDVGLRPARVEGAWDAPPRWRDFDVPQDVELVAVTHNETSTGAMWPAAELAGLRARLDGPLLAVDVTSSFGALATDWTGADVWFGSVQKCLGLPAGLGFLLVGPRALARAAEIGTARRVAAWQDLVVLARRTETGETVETPNVLAIALLGRQMRRWDLAEVEDATRAKSDLLADAFPHAASFVGDPDWRSPTVHNLVVDDPAAWRTRADAAGFELGNGYGKLRTRCVRIANFPAHAHADVHALIRALADD